jgi:transposase InsO family protein
LERDIEILVLRHQVKVLNWKVKGGRFRPLDRVLLGAASRALPRSLWSSFIVRPQTLLRWHRELVRRKWTFRRKSTAGGAPLEPGTIELILRLGRENRGGDISESGGELLKLGIRVSATTIRAVLLRNGLQPAPRRGGPTWGEFLRSQADGVLAIDFFTVETVALRTIDVLYAIQLSRRGVHVVGATRNPDSAWVTQKARNLVIDDRLNGVLYVLHDRDAKFCGSFDEVLRTEGARVIPTPIRAPNANAFAERFVRTIRGECLDHVLIHGRRHLERVLQTYVKHYIEERPHRGLGLATPQGQLAPVSGGPKRTALARRDVLGGLIHEYRWAA